MIRQSVPRITLLQPRFAVLAGLLILCCALGHFHRAGAQEHIYWVEANFDSLESRILRTNFDGTAIDTLATEDGVFIRGLAIDERAGKLYWGYYKLRCVSGIRQANLDGSGIIDLEIANLGCISRLVVDTQTEKLYFFDGAQIRRANLDGTDLEDLVPEGGIDLAIDTTHGKLYWSTRRVEVQQKIIRRANLDGSNAEDVLVGLSGPVTMDIDGEAEKIYYLSSNTILRANLDGTHAEHVLFPYDNPYSINLAVPHGKMYWFGSTGGEAKIMRASLDGSEMELLVDSIRDACCLLVAGTSPIVSAREHENSQEWAGFALGQNYPNPFYSSTTIPFELSRAGHVSLKVYNLLGQEVARLVDGLRRPGKYTVHWNGTGFPSGIYMYRFQVGAYGKTKPLTLLE